MAEIGVSAATLEALERDFEEVIRDLGGEDNIERFRLEYEKLHRALKKSHESERKLVKKCQELSQEIMSNAAKIQSVIKLSQEDHNTIEALKKEIEKAWKMVDGAHEKEGRAKETIQQLKKEAATLSALIEKGAALTQGQMQSLQELADAKKELVEERDRLSSTIGQQLHELRDLAGKKHHLDGELTQRDDDLKRVMSRLVDLRREFEKEQRGRDRAEAQLRELTQQLQLKQGELHMHQQKLEQKEKEVEERTTAIALLEARNDEDNGELGSAAKAKEKKCQEYKEWLQKAIKDESDARDVLSKLTVEMKELESSLQSMRYDEGKLVKAADQQTKLIRKMEQERDDLVREGAVLQRHIESLNSQEKVLGRERERLDVDMLKIERDTTRVTRRGEVERLKQRRIADEIGAVEDERKILESELDAQLKANQELRQQVQRLKSERERFAKLSSEAAVKHQQAIEDAKMTKMHGDDLQKQIEEASRRLVAQQVKYEQVRSDRNMYSKNLIESQDEISEMRQKFKIMDHQIDQLKEELSMKERKHFEAESNHKNVSEKLVKLRKRINSLLEQYEEAKGQSESLSQEIKQLTKVINTCDVELEQQQQQFLAVTHERDILGTQLIRRNDELALLYEKIRIQQATLSKGEVQFRDRVVDIRMLKLKIQELKRQVHMAQVRVKNVDDLKAQATTLTRQLALERTKVQALSEELENPQNFLRWRKLEGTDLKPAEKERRIQALQKRLINVTEQVVEKDIVISEKEKLYVELKAILARQPGPEVAEQLNVYQQDLRSCNQQMKCIAGELNMTASQSSEYKYELERLQRELQEAKKQYFEMRMTNQTLMRDRAAATVGGAAVRRAQERQFAATS